MRILSSDVDMPNKYLLGTPGHGVSHIPHSVQVQGMGKNKKTRLIIQWIKSTHRIINRVPC